MATAGIVTEYLLKSNIVPSPLEEVAAQQTLKRINDDLLDINSEIAKTRVILANLEERRILVEAERKAYLSVLSPVRRLPLEIIAHFLQLSLPEVMERKAQRLVLNRYNVCRPWRQAALTTPSLWSVLDIELDQYLKKNERELSKKVQKGISKWIIRSGSLPLTLSFSSARDNPHLLPRFVNWLPDKNRWKNVTIRVYKSWQPKALSFLLSSHTWDLLEYLELQADQSHMNQAHPIVMHNARNLKRLIWDIRCSAGSTQIPFMPWSQLFELSIVYSISVTQSLIILKECQNLQICKLSIDGPTQIPHGPLSSPILLPRLRQLNLMMYCKISPFILSLKLPNLNEFILGSCDDKLAPFSIAEFIRTSRCPIHKMVFQSFIVEDDENFAILLAEMTSLVELQLGFVERITGNFLYEREVREALRNLEVLAITVFRPEFNLYSLQEFAEYCYRQEIVNLKHINLEIWSEDWEDGIPKDDVLSDMQVINEGLTVEINYSEY